MDDHIRQKRRESVTYKAVFYIGDGSNDLCPSLRLTKGDIVFPRENYSLARKLCEQANQIQAQVVPWKCATEIISYL